jgi:NAD(P)-dependent dehydrogenase (short-subunit alcohol dehydrogenase family)
MLKQFNLQGKTSIVTGAGRGLGKEIALALANAGCDVVVVVASRTKNEIEKTANEIIKIGRSSIAIQTDVTKLSDVENLVEKTLSCFSKIDILVNNSGIVIVKPFLNVTEKEWEKVIDVNLNGTFLCCKIVGKHMVERKYGKIINVSSVDGFVGVPNVVSYCASKAGVILLTKALALEWARYNINVNVVAPGYFESGMTKIGIEDEKRLKWMLSKIPQRRIARPEEIVPLVIYLASDSSNYVTGSVFVIDGGRSIG